jgi:hypothetical protein
MDPAIITGSRVALLGQSLEDTVAMMEISVNYGKAYLESKYALGPERLAPANCPAHACHCSANVMSRKCRS